MPVLFRRYGCLEILNQTAMEAKVGKIARIMPHIQLAPCGRYSLETLQNSVNIDPTSQGTTFKYDVYDLRVVRMLDMQPRGGPSGTGTFLTINGEMLMDYGSGELVCRRSNHAERTQAKAAKQGGEGGKAKKGGKKNR